MSSSLVPQVSLFGHGGMSGGQRTEAEGGESFWQFGARPGQSDHYAYSEQEEGAEGWAAQDKGVECYSVSLIFCLLPCSTHHILLSAACPLSFSHLIHFWFSFFPSVFFPLCLYSIHFSHPYFHPLCLFLPFFWFPFHFLCLKPAFLLSFLSISSYYHLSHFSHFIIFLPHFYPTLSPHSFCLL